MVWTTTLLGLTLDLWTKHWAFGELKARKVIIENVLSFHQNLNAGALWGMGQGMAPAFIVASVFAIAFVFYIFSKSQSTQHTLHLGLGMVLGGALGNLYDRLFEGGKVRDFIKLDLAIGRHELWPWVFNVADMLLVCGVTILLLNVWFERKGDKETHNGESPSLQAQTN